jgi:hypothetical protein
MSFSYGVLFKFADQNPKVESPPTVRGQIAAILEEAMGRLNNRKKSPSSVLPAGSTLVREPEEQVAGDKVLRGIWLNSQEELGLEDLKSFIDLCVATVTDAAATRNLPCRFEALSQNQYVTQVLVSHFSVENRHGGMFDRNDEKEKALRAHLSTFSN